MPQYHDGQPMQRFRIIPTIDRIRREFAAVRIIVLSAWADPIMVHQALLAGASGYISKSDSDTDIGLAIKLVVQSGVFLSERAASAYAKWSQVKLTERQLEVLTVISHNPTLSYAELADQLGVTEGTLKKHLSTALKRLGVPYNRLAAIRICENLGLIAPSVV
jgi:two-component system response regulator DesR